MAGNHFSLTGDEWTSIASGGSIEAEAVCSWGSAGRVGEIRETSGPRTYINIKQRQTATGRETHASLLPRPHQRHQAELGSHGRCGEGGWKHEQGPTPQAQMHRPYLRLDQENQGPPPASNTVW